MAFSTILYITASLALSPLVSARGRGGGGGGGTTGPWCSEDIKIGDGYCLPKFYVIVPSIIVGLVIIAITVWLCRRYNCVYRLKRRAAARKEKKEEAQRLQGATAWAEAEVARDAAWAENPQNWTPLHSQQPSHQTLPYAQGGLGYTGKEQQMVYTPPMGTPATTYSATPYHYPEQQQPGGQPTYLQPYAPPTVQPYTPAHH